MPCLRWVSLFSHLSISSVLKPKPSNSLPEQALHNPRNLRRVPTHFNSSHHAPSIFIIKQGPNWRAHQLLPTLIFRWQIDGFTTSTATQGQVSSTGTRARHNVSFNGFSSSRTIDTVHAARFSYLPTGLGRRRTHHERQTRQEAAADTPAAAERRIATALQAQDVEKRLNGEEVGK